MALCPLNRAFRADAEGSSVLSESEIFLAGVFQSYNILNKSCNYQHFLSFVYAPTKIIQVAKIETKNRSAGLTYTDGSIARRRKDIFSPSHDRGYVMSMSQGNAQTRSVFQVPYQYSSLLGGYLRLSTRSVVL